MKNDDMIRTSVSKLWQSSC